MLLHFFTLGIIVILPFHCIARQLHSHRRIIHCERVEDVVYFTKCSAHGEYISTDVGQGCYDEFDPRIRNIRQKCPVVCPGADSYEITAKVPNTNHVCTKFFNYGLSRNDRDVYLWRAGGCSNETITFEVNCGFATGDRSEFELLQQIRPREE